ncbi:unnamed protein product [Dovyalis caffra]|uniref:Pectinesterase catalytic domain-containing protein n=1 Tax=Dovyalis caffra TaxID=77055 RepID=A0AAV1SJS7_9ROSI|nr:unnamed protein product [Dovyalis caffra]
MEQNGLNGCQLGTGSRLLQATTVTPNVVVAADGSGNYWTVLEAVLAAPERSSSRYIIRIKAGVYREMWMCQGAKPTLCLWVMEGQPPSLLLVEMWLMAAPHLTLQPLVVTSATEVQPLTARNFVGGASWLPSTGFPYTLDL